MQAEWAASADEYLLPGQTLVVGLSGGMDSVALLHWLSHNGETDHFRLAALHVHHGLSHNADQWAAHCETLCAALDIPLSIEMAKVERHSRDGLEGAARRARHSAFSRADGDWIVLAHHRGDQAETLLFNLLRGCGVRGAGAMRRRQGRLLRPWLALGRDDIEKYALETNLRWVEDESNADVRYNRNFLRHQVVPKLSERFPAADERLRAAADQFADAQELLDELALMDLAGVPPVFPVPMRAFAYLSDKRAANLLAYLLRESGVSVTSRNRLVEAVRQFLTAAADRHPSVRFGEYHLRRRRGMIELVLQTDPRAIIIDNNESGGNP